MRIATVLDILLLCSVAKHVSSQTGVCFRSRSRTVSTSTRTTTTYTTYYRCWITRCSRTSYRSRYVTEYRREYYSVFGCCSGYVQIGGRCVRDCRSYCDSNHICTAQHACVCPSGWTGSDCSEAICINCDSNHVCTAPNICVCPAGVTGSDCSEDINECAISTPCEQNCTNSAGSYSCTCSRGYSLTYDLHGCLGPPQAVSMLASSSTSLEISWNSPVLDSWDGSVQQYHISCSSSSGWNVEFATPSYRHSYQVNLLTPFSTYNCWVAARTSSGLSSSSCYTESTLEDRPLDPPQTIAVVNMSASALFISWHPPSTPNGIITLYNIFLTYENQSREIITVNSTESSYILEGLSPYQLVYVNMSASTAAGEGPTSLTLYGRTSQTVPTGVTSLKTRSLSLHQIQISWQPPEAPNGILSEYRVTVYNLKLNYTQSVSVGPTVLNVTISDNIEPLVPYTVLVQAFTRAGGGVVEVQTMFTQEGVPGKPPTISSLSREDATTGQVIWDLLNLDELRGFLHSYKVIYQEFKSYSCVGIDVEGGEALSVTTESATLTGLNPTAEYCVAVAASTAAGVGNYSHSILPVYTNFLFQIHFHGIHNCPLWVNDEPLEKISVFVDIISKEMSTMCDCFVPTDHIGDTRLICNEESPNRVVIQGRMIETHARNTTELTMYLAQWVSTSPHVVVQGVQIVAEKNCSIKLSELGDSTCVLDKEETEKMQTDLSEASKFPVIPVAVGIIITILLVALIILAATSILVLRKKTMKPASPPSNIYNADPSSLYSGGIPMSTAENCSYGIHHKACPKEYETPNLGRAEENNLYETIQS